MKILRRFAFHPLLLGVYPVFALLAHNVEDVALTEVLRALLFSFSGTVILFLVLKFVLHDWDRASLVCALSILLFYSYGHIYSLLEEVNVLGLQLGRHRFLIPVWLGILALCSWWVVRRLRNPLRLTAVLNVSAIVALVLPLSQIAFFQVRLELAQSEAGKLNSKDCALYFPSGQTPPDIYYIILDGYTREDVLREVYAYDNADFIDVLTEMGFYVAGRSQSNYAQSALSLASSLNFNYLEALGDGVIPGSDDRWWLWPKIQHSVTRRELECLGYSIITFETSYIRTQIEDADIYLTPRQDVLSEFQAFVGVNGFEAMLIQSSAALIITDAVIVLPKFLIPDVKAPFQAHRERILFILDRLEGIPEIPGPKFIFAHIISPHAPYIFGPDGEYINPIEDFTLGGDREEGDREYHFNGYRNQITFLNGRLERLLAQIISRSETPPIIIIQADHGGPLTSSGDRMAILNAYWLPDGGSELLYETISPINTFRVIFNIYFGGGYDLIEDVSYYSSYNDPYNFIIIPNR